MERQGALVLHAKVGFLFLRLGVTIMHGDLRPLTSKSIHLFFQLTVKSIFGPNGANALQPAEMEQKQEIVR